jgi:hypothetical protein
LVFGFRGSWFLVLGYGLGSVSLEAGTKNENPRTNPKPKTKNRTQNPKPNPKPKTQNPKNLKPM